MAYDLEEQEKLDELKDWWNRWGTLVTAVIVAAALAVLAYRAWNYYQANQASKAALLYEQLDKAIAGKQMPLVKEITGTMLDRYSGTAYAQMAALSAAKANLDTHDVKSAQTQLEWAAEHARDPEYRWVAKLRLAGVLLDEGQADLALKQLDGEVPVNFEAAFDDRRGDILATQGKFDLARAQYEMALTKLVAVGNDVRTAYTNVIQLKLDALGSAVAANQSKSTATGAVAPEEAKPTTAATPDKPASVPTPTPNPSEKK
ncbi:MAG: tetratricopeptide repeat protein [Burkholderiaceae bacterium]